MGRVPAATPPADSCAAQCPLLLFGFLSVPGRFHVSLFGHLPSVSPRRQVDCSGEAGALEIGVLAVWPDLALPKAPFFATSSWEPWLLSRLGTPSLAAGRD